MQICVIRLCEKSMVFKLIKDFNFEPGLSTLGPSVERLYKAPGSIQVDCKFSSLLNPKFKYRIEIGNLSGIEKISFPRRSKISSCEFENAPLGK